MESNRDETAMLGAGLAVTMEGQLRAKFGGAPDRLETLSRLSFPWRQIGLDRLCRTARAEQTECR